MGTVVDKVREEIFENLKNLKSDSLKEALDFICFLKAKEVIDPSQTYFWTKTWQRLEKEADRDKKAGRVIGDGSVEGLLKELKP